MENASKALIIAGSILITIIVISLGVIVFRNMSNSVQNNASLDREQIAIFNSKISPYLGENVSGSQVNNLMQLVRTINQKADNEGDTLRKINISYNDKSGITRVATGKYYSVKGDYKSGLLTIIKVKDN